MYFIGKEGFENRNMAGRENINAYTSGFLKIYEYYPTVKFNMGKTYYMLGMNNYDYTDEVVHYYSDGMIANSKKYGNMEQALIAKEYFEKGVELGEKKGYYVNNLNALINLEMTLGNNERAYELILSAKNSDVELVKQMALINEIVYYGKVGEYDRALQLCEDNIGDIPLLEEYRDSINYIKGDFEEIEPEKTTMIYTDEIIEENKIKAKRNSILVSADILKDIDFIEVRHNYETVNTDNVNFAKVSGKVIVKGKAIPNAKVFIRNWYGISFDQYGRVNFTRGLFNEGQATYTNENGEFSFENVFPGKDYEIVVSIPSVFVDNASRKENEKISLTGGEDIKVDIVCEEALTITAVNTDYDKDQIDNGELKPTSESYLGSICGEEVTISVIAYDSEGKVISRSIEPVKLDIKKKDLNEGEKLIIEGRIDEAYNWLYERLEEEPMNKEYMYPLMRIAYDRGNIEFGDELINRLEEINETGFDKAMRFYYVRE